MNTSLSPLLSEKTASELNQMRELPHWINGKQHTVFCQKNGDPLSNEALAVLRESLWMLIRASTYLQNGTPEMRDEVLTSISASLGVRGRKRTDHVVTIPALPL
jgi:hypothetical protein